MKTGTYISIADTVSFSGLHSSESEALFFFDIDGTFAHGIENNDSLEQFNELSKKTNAILCFATGRNLEKFKELQAKMSKKGIDFPTPQFLIARNGLYIYENIDGELVENAEWKDKVYNSFNRDKIFKSIQDLAFLKQFSMPGKNVEKSKDFADSKICTFEFWPSDRALMYACDNSIADNIVNFLETQLKKDNLHAKVIKMEFTKEECDRLCDEAQLSIINPRYAGKDYFTQLFVNAANKADAIEFVRQRLRISPQEVVMAGNDGNDISMVDLTKKGMFFIEVANRVDSLKNYINALRRKDNTLNDNLILTENEGLKGIIEGIKRIITQ